ncbi:kinase-like domain [Cordyceps militaris]|uniref:Kinase-like domain n=1 Tax=Cordyceps militaris TaxID=73501 RepID=A0A2H4SV02_CORMI|nr:kinase-like domain [Cordyceps militaris]
MAKLPKHSIEYHSTSMHEDDHDASFKVRRNGKIFYIQISPSHFVDSPVMTQKYLVYLEVLRSGEEVIDDIYDTDVFEWVMTPFEALLVELAPPPPGDPKQTQISLQQHLFPEVFVFDLEIINEKPCPRRILSQTPPFRPSFCLFDEPFLDELEEWTHFYDPARIMLSFTDLEDALFKQPRKVLIDDGQVECFFKPCHSSTQATRELKSYKAITAAGLYDGQLNLCRMHGVVMDDHDFILGILLTYVDGANCPLSARVDPEDPDDPPMIWGDVKAENVLIDESNNALVTDFGGGYTQGWVDKALAETIEGDAMGMAKIRKLLFPCETES